MCEEFVRATKEHFAHLKTHGFQLKEWSQLIQKVRFSNQKRRCSLGYL